MWRLKRQEGALNVTVAMSDHDYGLLLQAVGWIEHHAGTDAPEYAGLGRLSLVVDNIGKRREPEMPHESEPVSPGTTAMISLIGLTGQGEASLNAVSRIPAARL